ncbi:MAG: dihydropteroate synthase [Bacteroidetes bacterium]|jgi:dihydropteroate synthase|nr:dihydropteroate synthase [Bacteroidota bacterium]
MSRQVTHFGPNRSLKANGKILNISRPVVMGIVNITPDSFYDGGNYKGTKDILKDIGKKADAGASIIDLGAASSRPGSDIIDVDTELKRLLPVLKVVRNTFPDLFISIDTWRSEVAMAAAELGADIINDISAGDMDAEMLNVVAQTKLPYIFMHMQGTPQTMQKKPVYKDAPKDVYSYLSKKKTAAEKAGIKQLIADPGFGFGKTVAHNFELLNKLETFHKLDVPILAGLSRKSLILKTLEQKAKEALNGTTVVNTIALLKGAKILRVHDVKEAMEAIKLVNAMNVQ